MYQALKEIGLSIAIGWGIGIATCITIHSACATNRNAMAQSIKAIRNDQDEWVVYGNS